MKYLLFAGHTLPGGGWNDMHGAFEKPETTIDVAKMISDDNTFWSHVVDVLTHERIWDSTRKEKP